MADRPALMKAVMRNEPEIVTALIEAGVLLDETEEGETALHWAVYRRHTEIVTMLLQAGANPNVADDYGYTPLHDVAEMGDQMLLEELLAAGADPNLREKSGRTPSELGMGTSFQTTAIPQSPSRSCRAADDFAMIRARMEELKTNRIAALRR
jgi:ankyrin repeat protein